MESYGFLRLALFAEGLALAVLVVFYLFRGWRNTRYRRVTHPIVEELRRETMRVLIDPEGMGELIRRLTRLPRRLQVRVVLSLAPSLAGRQRNELVGVAGEIGLVSYAATMCHSSRWFERLEGARLMTALGADAAIMTGLLGDPHPLVRAQAAEWVGEHPDRRSIERLIALLNDPERVCRFSARESLLEIGEAAIEPVAELLEAKEDDDVTPEELEVVVGLADLRFLQVAIRLTEHESPMIRGIACRVLGAIGAGEGVEALVTHLDDPEPEPREEAAWALGLLGHWPAGPRMAELLTDRNFQVRRSAGFALKTMGAPGEVLLRRVAKSQDRYAAAMARHALDTPGAIPAGRRLT